jgi:hypothetical protein
MPYIDPKIQSRTQKNVNPIEVENFVVDKFDCHLDDANSFVRRHGLALYYIIDTVGQIDGAYEWFEKDLLIVVANGDVYKVTKLGEITQLNGGNKLNSNVRPTFATNGTALVIANGKKPLKVLEDGTSNFLPTQPATHVDYLDGYFLANEEGTGRFTWSDLNDIDTWTPSNFATAEGNQDNITALFVLNREINLFGVNSLEVWFNDGVSPFSRINGGFTEKGLIAPYSLVFANNTLHWLAEDRRFVRREGRNAVSLSSAFDKEIQKLNTVDDAQADSVDVDGETLVYISFPTEGRTFVYDYGLNDWWEASFFDSANNLRERYLGNVHVNMRSWGYHLVGSRKDGRIFRLLEDEQTDDGTEIVSQVITGHADQGTMQRKRSSKLLIKMESGSIGWVSRARLYEDLQGALKFNEILNAGDVVNTDVPYSSPQYINDKAINFGVYNGTTSFITTDLSAQTVNKKAYFIRYDIDSTPAAQRTLFSSEDVIVGGDTYNLNIFVDGGGTNKLIAAIFKNSSSVAVAQTDAVLTTGVNDIAIFTDGAAGLENSKSIVMYLNGSLVSTVGTATYVNFNLSTDFRLGNSPNSGGFLSGDLFDFSILDLNYLALRNHTQQQIVDALRSNKYGGNEHRFVTEYGVTLKRNPQLMLRSNRDNVGFGEEIRVPLGAVGTTEFIKPINLREIYRTRQLDIKMSDPSPFIFSGIEEDVKALKR